MLGQHVRSLVSGRVGEGMHTVRWDGTDENGRAVSSGVYLYRIRTGNFVASRKMLLLK
jgi:flagellar hook assembly protein FlgD